MGRFVITGSQQFGFMAGITQSLAGRVGELKLLPFCLPELRDAGKSAGGADAVLYEGFYPAVHVRDTDPVRWYNGYVGTYLERDVRSMTAVQDLRAFQAFLRLAAGRCGQLLNLSSLGSAAGVSHNTAKAWLSVLEASFITFTLLPFHKNFNKRLIKSPKLYFYDTGLVSRLLGLTCAEQLELHPLRGAVFENFVVSEAVKSCFNRALPSPCFFWRDSAGQEIDLIFENGLGSFPVEIKSGKTVAGDFFDGLRKWKSLSGADGGALVFGGSEAYEREGFQVVPWNLSYELAERQCFAAPPAIP
jgi:predicted AAA+ superfamily ATPase